MDFLSTVLTLTIKSTETKEEVVVLVKCQDGWLRQICIVDFQSPILF